MTYSITGIFPANESSYEDREAALREWEFTVCQTLSAVKFLRLREEYISFEKKLLKQCTYYDQ